MKRKSSVFTEFNSGIKSLRLTRTTFMCGFGMKGKRLVFLGAAIAQIFGMASIASADFTAVHKSVDATTGKSKIFLPGVASGATIDIKSEGAPKPRVVTLNYCGWGKFSDSTTNPIKALKDSSGGAVTATDGTAPTCTAGTTAGTWVDSNSAATVGTVIKAGTQYWVKGGSTIGAYVIQTVQDVITKPKGNACGWASITTSDTKPLTSFFVGAATTAQTLSTVPATTTPMLCRKIGLTYSNYVPAAGFGAATP